ncbi:MAG: DUF692 domain-containing protein [Candidatus Thiodiazotropha sp. (ex Lucina aurantia)]|nr:DUF692 domain-containing protein [Candidatus Thiodiazotropha sp. (ex Lucina pensylvanica)]MBT3016242.1 DUF692 domain-containing protein [Candidatus Thiodiazotropha taylori]MBV2097388.1 DUF692 domain-containing protein [Candidatus Thiodiazotropha sp. (ex Codakia orbicularis)]MBV2102238.1 DUF692 domain-containing protein [Candidatus Thiodiazotropha sp. (ex Lucina aurantia)]MBT3022165.1 DUF692 domain-containing protein [Candidatus Thiodiazotropha taylori]
MVPRGSFVNESVGIQRPFLGYGLGLRRQHYDDVLESRPDVDWFEIISENYMVDGGKPLHYLSRIRERYPMVMHGVSMSIGSIEPLDYTYLKKLKELIERVEPMWFSDHLCWTGVNKLNLHDLLPLPYTEEALDHVVERITRVQDYLGRQMLLENVSSYISYSESQLSEWEFLREVVERADCLVLLDINNIYVSAYNHNFDPSDFVRAMPSERIYQIHLAGHTQEENLIIDTHDHPIADPVYELYAEAIQRFGRVSTMIERDDNIPPLADLLRELDRVRRIGETSFEDQVA